MNFYILKLADFNIIISLLSLIAAWKWGDWRNWKKYYSTILFFMLVNFAYGYITYNYPLWKFESPFLKSTLSTVFITLTTYPSTILLFLPHYPNKWDRKIVYTLKWVTIYSILEFTSIKLGYFTHHNGWTMWWSVLFNCVMFPTLRLHHQKPLFAWIVTIILAVAILHFWGLSFSSMK